MKINQCPFCGADGCRVDTDINGHWVFCFDCKAHGPKSHSVKGAVDLWNLAGEGEKP